MQNPLDERMLIPKMPFFAKWTYYIRLDIDWKDYFSRFFDLELCEKLQGSMPMSLNERL